MSEFEHGRRIADQDAGMSLQAINIAISEIRGLPEEQMCSWLLITWTHSEAAGDGHELGMLSPAPLRKRLKLARLAAADLEHVLARGQR